MFFEYVRPIWSRAFLFSLVIGISVIAAQPVSAAVSQVDLVLEEDIDDVLSLSVQPNDMNILAVTINNKAYPPAKTVAGFYEISGLGKVGADTHVKIYYAFDDSAIFTNPEIRIKYKAEYKPADIIELLPDIEGPLIGVTDSLSFGIVGVEDTNRVGFTIGAASIEPKGEIWFVFPESFNLLDIDSAAFSYSDDDPANDADEPAVNPDSSDVIIWTLVVKLDDGTPAAPNSRISIRFAPVTNPTVANNYSVYAMTFDSTGNMIYISTASAPFAIAPGSLDHVEVTPGGAITAPSDTLITFTAAGYDQYDNSITGLNFTWDITVDSCGTINNGAFRALKRGTCYATAVTGGITDSSGLITVTHGSFYRFGLTGYPVSRIAGQAFPSPVVVTAYDINNNRIYDYADSVYFFSSDNNAVFTYNETNLYHFQPADSGRYNFAGANFQLRTSGLQTIGVTNGEGTDTTTSASINVTPASMNSFTFSALGNQTAGVPFFLNVTNARDAYGNFAVGTISITAVEGGGNSPNGTPPVINDITINNDVGIGSARQTLTSAEPTGFLGSIGLVDVYTDTIAVLPGASENLLLTNYPDTITAGQTFPSPANDLSVAVTDNYGNACIFYTGTVAFSGADSIPAAYQFQLADSGSHVFPGTAFRFETSGQRKLNATDQADNTLTDTSSVIQVYSASVVSFTLSAPASATAGTAFDLTVSSAVDEFGNAASGVAVITVQSGGGNSPGGVPPTINNINVANGGGSASQVLTNAVATVFRGTIDGHIDDTDAITVNPGSPGSLKLTNYPTSIIAGVTFPSPANDPVVTLRDNFGNIKTDYTGTVSFSGADSVHDDYIFQLSDAGQKSFPGTAFRFEQSGNRKLIVTDAANSLADTSSIIQVSAAAINSFILMAPGTVTAGAAFSLTVSSALDEFNNPADGVIAVSVLSGGGNSPWNIPPSINNISVANGSGSAAQVLTNTVATVLRGTINGHVDDTEIIDVDPGAAGNLSLTNYPDTITAGQTFPSPANDPVVTIRDGLGNIKTDYTGTVSFSGADSVHDDYAFPVDSAGTAAFPGSAFMFELVGQRRLIASDNAGSIADTSDIIEVLAEPAISSFTLSAPASVTAGSAFTLTASNVIDQYGNPASGTVTVTVQSGGGSSPGGVPPSINNISVIGGSGSAIQTLTNAVTTVLRGSANGFFDDTDNITVNPAAAGRIYLSNYPDSITAGATFPSPANDPEVRVTDSYGNVKTNYTGTVTFSGADSVHNDYVFIPGDAGIHSFPGSAFRFELVGARKLIVADNAAVIADTSSIIQVFAAPIADFNITVNDTVTAGVAFTLGITGAIDQFGNNASGTVIISDSLGAGNSPDGTPPILNNIPVSNGSGSSEQVLVSSGFARLKAAIGSVIGATDTITVMPGVLRELKLTVATPQVSGVPFLEVSTLTAKDDYGNVKTDYDASVDTIAISASTGGGMTNNVLDQAGDFVNGVADLHALNVTYHGLGGQVVFTAASESGITGESNVVNVVSLHADNLSLTNDQVFRGDTARGTVACTNFGNVNVDIIDIDIFDQASSLVITPIFDPVLPLTLPSGSDTTFSFGFEVPLSAAAGFYPLKVAFTGQYTGLNTYDTLAVWSDTLNIVTPSYLEYIANSLDPDTVSIDESYSFNVVVDNVGGSSISLHDTTYLYFTDGAAEYRADLGQGRVVGPGVQRQLSFESTVIPASFTGGLYEVKIYIHGSDIAGAVLDSITLSDSIMTQTGTNINYLAGSLTPDTVPTGSVCAFAVRVNNAGEASLEINHDLTRFSFTDGSNSYLALIDTAASVRIDRILPGVDTTLTFAANSIPTGFVTGNYQPVVHIEGVHNYRNYVADLDADTVTVLIPGQIRLDSLYSLNPISNSKPARVNISQGFGIHGFIRNLGMETIDSVTLAMSSDGNSAFSETLYVGTIQGQSGAPFSYDITADTLPNPAEIFTGSIIKAINSISNQPAAIASPLDNTASAVIEDSASLWLDTLYLSDYSLSTGQRFTVSLIVGHSGGGNYDGSNQVIIGFNEPGVYQVADSLARDFSPGQVVSWQVIAPDSVRSSDTISVAFRGAFIDLNDSTTALKADSIRTAIVSVTDHAAITHNALITAPEGAIDGILSTSQFFTITDSLFLSGNAGETYARLYLPSRFTSLDPLSQPLTGQAVEWLVSACNETTVDSLRLECWSHDSNTGDSVYDQTIWIPVQVVERASLSLGLEIIEPPSALDRIIMPGGEFTLRATVTRTGEAMTGQGEITLLFENSGFLVEEQATVQFTPDIPVLWHVTAPDTQILDGTQIAAALSSVPVDSNSGEPASVLTDSAGFDIVLKDELPGLVLDNPEALGGAVVSGESIDVFRFRLRNTSDVPGFQIALIELGFRIMSGENVIAPANLISSSRIYINDDPGFYYDGAIGDSLVVFALEPHLLIGPDSSAAFTINITPVENPAVKVFRIYIESGDIIAQAVIGGVYDQYIEVVLPGGQQFTLESMPLTVLQGAFLNSVTVNNNPYLASSGNLEIGYNLDQDATIDFAIYNVHGEKVWEFQATPANGFGVSGQHYNASAVSWNGTNDAGDKILSGVYYILVSNNDNGQTAKIKVAVIW
jgi:hypothetical protein